MSVIYGVLQMTIGVFIKLSNALKSKKMLDAFWEALPQIIFLLWLFGLMDLLIVLKWNINWP